MKVLAVDSSSKAASVAILEDFKILAEVFLDVGLTHSQTLAPITESLIKNSGIDTSQIDLFAVTSGPGSFTGLRIGMSLVKGLALPYHTPCIGVSSLLASAYASKDFNGTLFACIDARKEEVYNAVFKPLNSGLKRIVQDRSILIEELKAEIYSYQDKIKLVGDAAKMCYNIFKDYYNIDVSQIYFGQESIKASNVGFAAIDLYKKGEFSTACDIRPTYLKVCQAERMLNERSERR